MPTIEATLTIAPPPVGDHRPRGGAGAQESAGHVDRDHLVPIRQSEFNRRTADRNARVVDENVDAPFACEGRLDHRLDAGFICHVDRDRERREARPRRIDAATTSALALSRSATTTRAPARPASRRSRDRSRALRRDDRNAIVETHEITNIRHDCPLSARPGFPARSRLPAAAQTAFAGIIRPFDPPGK